LALAFKTGFGAMTIGSRAMGGRRFLRLDEDL
jgi:hypothetical protein